MKKHTLLIVSLVAVFVLSFTLLLNKYQIINLLENKNRLVQVSDKEINAYFTTVDKDGKPLRPDKAWWYYPPNEQGQAAEYPARCLNDSCTHWGVLGATGRRIYIAASTRREHPTSKYCSYVSYNASSINLSSSLASEITLVLEEHVSCE